MRATVERSIGIEDGVACIHETRTARGELHARRHQVHGDVVASRPGIDVGIEAVGVDQLPGHLPQDGAPHEADAVRHGDGGVVRGRVGVVVLREVGAVGRGPDAATCNALSDHIGANAAAIRPLVAYLNGHHQPGPIAPALAHLLGIGQAVHVGRTAHQAVADPMRVFVRYNAIVYVAIAVRCGIGPHVHLHAGRAALCRRGEVGVVRSAAVLCVGQHVIIAGATPAIVVALEVAAGIIEAVLVPDVVHQVVPVIQVRDGGVLVGAGCAAEVDHVIEIQRGAHG